jgi:hypothetical protein
MFGLESAHDASSHGLGLDQDSQELDDGASPRALFAAPVAPRKNLSLKKSKLSRSAAKVYTPTVH